MIPGCTSALPIELDDTTIDLGAAAGVWVTISQGDTVITITGDQIETEGNELTAYLTQEQTLCLDDNAPAKGQVNWTYEDSGTVSRGATDPFDIQIGEQLLRRVLP